MATRMQKKLSERFGLDVREGYVPLRHRTRLTYKREAQTYCWQTDRGSSRLIKH